VKKLLSGNETFALGVYHARANVADGPLMAASDKGREEVSSANIG
jgi:hypothetical protein